MTASSPRLLSLDIARGITVAAMIMVNNNYGKSFEMLGHAKWNGLSAADLVFPFFLFIMGISIFLSYSRRGFELNRSNFIKILRRTIILFAIGIGINWLDKILHTDLTTSLAELRFWAVLQRIAICYFVVSIFALTIKHRYTLPSAIGLLAIYTIILLCGNGYVNERDANILWLIDEHIFGYPHLYHYQSVDPEGLISTISAICNVMFGFYCAYAMSRKHTVTEKVSMLFTVGSILVFAAFLLQFGLPYNKRIWSPSFACITSGFCALMIALLMQLIDGRRQARGPWVDFFEVFGINALILYVSSELMAIILRRVGLNEFLFGAIAEVIPCQKFASLAYATVYMLLNWAIGYPLWRRRIIIKL